MGHYQNVVFHICPHAEEYVALLALRLKGEPVFPGIADARVIYWPAGGTPDGRPPEDWEKDGYLMVGVGHSRFDEHANGKGVSRDKECSATLVAKALGIDSLPEWRELLKFALHSDHNGSNPFGLDGLVKMRHAMNLENPEKVMAWALEILAEKYCEQIEFWFAAVPEFKKNSTSEEIVLDSGNTAKMVTVISDHRQIVACAFAREVGNADVVIKKSPRTGNVIVLTKKEKTRQRNSIRLSVAYVAGALRWYENELQGRPKITDQARLIAEGTLSETPEWYYDARLEGVLNGSNSAPNVPATNLPLEQIREIVRTKIYEKPL